MTIMSQSCFSALTKSHNCVWLIQQRTHLLSINLTVLPDSEVALQSPVEVAKVLVVRVFVIARPHCLTVSQCP